MFALFARIAAVTLVGVLGFVFARGGVTEPISAKAGTDRGGDKSSMPGLSALTKSFDLPLAGTLFQKAMAVVEEVDAEGSDRYPEIWAAVQNLPLGQREQMEVLVVDWWARADPEAALAAMTADQYEHFDEIYLIWAETDALKAWEHSRGMLYDGLRVGFEEQIVIGLARTDRMAAIDLAHREDVDFEDPFWSEWLAEDGVSLPDIGAQMVGLAAQGIFDGSDFESLIDDMSAEPGDVRELFDLVVASDGEWRASAIAQLVEGMAGDDIMDVFDRALADPEWLGEAVSLSRIFRAMSSDSQRDAQRFFRSLEPGDPLAAELVSTAIDREWYRDAAEAQAWLDMLPERGVDYLVEVASDTDRFEGGSVDERLQWVEFWKMDLGPEAYEEALSQQISQISSESLDDELEVDAALEAADRVGWREQMLEHFSFVTPEVATPWLFQTMAPEERAPYLEIAFENFIEDEPPEALAFFETLTHPSDIAALRRGLASASIPDERSEAANEVLANLEQ